MLSRECSILIEHLVMCI